MNKSLLFLIGCFCLISSFAYGTDVVIKSTTNAQEYDIGDYWIGEDFARGFRNLNLSTTVDYRNEYRKQHQPLPKINLYMRGYTKFALPLPEGFNVLYCYYPMAFFDTSKNKLSHDKITNRVAMPKDTSLDDDWQNFDMIAVASFSYAQKLNDAGIKAVFVPQFTNPEKFYPNPSDELKTDILFVGSNWHDRTSLRFALESGFEVAVYGYNWQGIVPPNMYKAPYIQNSDLNRYYSSAKIVLNDHRPDMKKAGFINNRIYDATASGTMVISDYMPEIEAIYGDSVPMYKSREELVQLLSYYLEHDNERELKAQQAREITLKHFTNKEAAKIIWEAVNHAQAN